MSDTQNAVDIPATDSVVSTPTAPASVAGEPQGSVPASVDPTVPPAETDQEKSDRQARREARALATQRRENRELHRELGYMRAQMEAIKAANGQQPSEGDAAPPQRQQTRSSPRDEAQAELNRSILERIEDAGEEYEAVVEKITADNFPLSVAMRDFLAVSDKPAELAKLLADDPKEARRISVLGERAADRAMEQLQARLSAKAAPKKTTQAPPPVPTVGGRSTAEFDLEKASMDEYVAFRKAQMRAKR